MWASTRSRNGRSKLTIPLPSEYKSTPHFIYKVKCCPQIFNRLIPVFGSAFRNLPESIIDGRKVTSKDRVEYRFKAFGSISMLFMEMKFKVGSAKERLDAIAQVIAEYNGQAFF